MINVFIDANVWLFLYDFSDDDLGQFRKLSDLIGKTIFLLLPSRVIDEVYRNRENKIKNVLNTFKFEYRIPNICKGYDEHQVLLQKKKELCKAHDDILKKVKADALKDALPADEVIDEIFNSITPIKCTVDLVNSAKTRFDMGYPPGKDKKYGDAVNWEALLASAPVREDLFFVTADKDYSSAIDDEAFNGYLLKEWKKSKQSDLHFYRSLTDFIKQHIPTIELKAKVVYLYFSDSQAMNFNMEERIIDGITPKKLIEELINGPALKKNVQTIPDGTKLIDIKIEEKIAFVNFSRELIDNHWGGSAGEIMTIGSIVNTLVLNKGTGIKKVQILIEGEKVETLAGHIDISDPLEPDE